ncbi:MAG: hypothetical protein ACRCTZ_14075 [Sarcina sp.]
MEIIYKNEKAEPTPKKTKATSTSDSKLDKLKVAYDSAMMFKELLDDITLDSTYKFLFLKQIYLDAGISLPKFIEEERV